MPIFQQDAGGSPMDAAWLDQLLAPLRGPGEDPGAPTPTGALAPIPELELPDGPTMEQLLQSLVATAAEPAVHGAQTEPTAPPGSPGIDPAAVPLPDSRPSSQTGPAPPLVQVDPPDDDSPAAAAPAPALPDVTDDLFDASLPQAPPDSPSAPVALHEHAHKRQHQHVLGAAGEDKPTSTASAEGPHSKPDVEPSARTRRTPRPDAQSGGAVVSHEHAPLQPLEASAVRGVQARSSPHTHAHAPMSPSNSNSTGPSANASAKRVAHRSAPSSGT